MQCKIYKQCIIGRKPNISYITIVPLFDCHNLLINRKLGIAVDQ